MVKVIRIPDDINLSHDSEIWGLLCSKPFSRIRCGLLENEIGKEGMDFLRRWFEKYCVLTKTPMPEEEYVGEKEELNFIMMKKAAYELTKQEVSR